MQETQQLWVEHFLFNNQFHKNYQVNCDKSLSRRDFKRIASPLSKFGAKFKLKKNFSLPLTIQGTKNIKSIKYHETRGSAQCKSAVMLAAMRANGTTYIKAKK